MCFKISRLCCLRLSTVGLVVGWFNLISSLLSGILMCVAFSKLDCLVKFIEDQIEDTSMHVGIKIAVIVFVSIGFTISVAHVIASFLLILGTVKERHLLLVPWLISCYIGMIFNTIILIYVVYAAIIADLEVGYAVGIPITIGVCLVVQCTIWNAVYSLFGEIRARNDRQRQPLLQSAPVSQYTSGCSIDVA